MCKNLSNKECLIMIKELQEILDTRGECISVKEWGICDNVSPPLNRRYIELWENFKRSAVFPISDEEDTRSASDQYYSIVDKWEGRQLELRLSLVTHLLKCYKEYYLINFS